MITTKFKLRPGLQVIDIISGLIGIIDGAAIKKNGSIQYSVQPKSLTGDTRPDSWFIDEVQLTLTDGTAPEYQDLSIDFKFSPGSLVKDKVTGIKGTIMYAIYWLNECKHYSIQPKGKKGATKKPESITCDESDLELVSDEMIAQAVAVASPSPGGPSMKSSSFRI